MDTGGIEPRTDDQILSFMRDQAQIAIENATVIIFLTDVRTGLTASDQEVANMLLRSGKPIVLAVNKPKGIVCTTSRKEKDNIVDFISYPERVYPVGRLDKDSEGLILMTNDGELMDEILRARNGHEKEYEVQVNRPVSERFLKEMAGGVPILDTVTRPCRIRKTGTFSFRIILTQGLNRQIRRMCEALGYRVRALKRIRVMNIHLGDLPEGEYRELTEAEIFELMRLTGRTDPVRRNRMTKGRSSWKNNNESKSSF